MRKPPPPHIVILSDFSRPAEQAKFLEDAAAKVPPGSASTFFRFDSAVGGADMHVIVGSSSAAQLLRVLTDAVEELRQMQGNPGFDSNPVSLHLSSDVLIGGR